MPTRRQYLRHVFAGGFATDFGPSANVSPNQAGDVLIPFLLDAENVYFELDGGPHKIGGTSKVNSSVINGGEEIRGLFDYWRLGTANTPEQRRLVYSGTTISKDTGNGTFAGLTGGLEDNKVPSFTVFNDAVIMATDSVIDTPRTYNGTTIAALGGSAPNFAFSCVHKNRLWAAGVATLPSRLYYCKTLDAGNWTHATSGYIDIDPDDGDRITGIASHKNDLWVFKGPYKGSIHRITGSANTGSDSFARITFINGIGAVSHNTLFKFRDDLGFMWADGTIHSLAATAAYGDFNESSLSRPIHRYFREHLTHNQLARAWAATDPARSIVAFAVPIDTGQFPNQVLVMDYSRQSVWWSLWPALNANCIARVIDPTQANRPLLMIGGRDGYVRKTDLADRAIDGATAIAYKVTTPYNNYGSAIVTKTITDASLGIVPKGAFDVALRWTRDDEVQQTITLEQGGGDVLGEADSNEFTLGTSALAGSQFVDRFTELDEGGEFRSISYQIYQGGLGEDMELHSFSTSIEIGAHSTENG